MPERQRQLDLNAAPLIFMYSFFDIYLHLNVLAQNTFFFISSGVDT